MTKPLSKSKKTVLITLAVILFIGLCFGSVGIYARHEINKPTLEVPVEEPVYINEIPEKDEEKLSYLKTKFDDAFTDNCEVSYSSRVETEAFFDENSGANSGDQALINLALESVKNSINDNYETFDKIRGDSAVKTFSLDADGNKLLSGENFVFDMSNGKTNDAGEIENEGRCFSALTVNSNDNDLYLDESFRKAFGIEQDEEILIYIKQLLSDTCDFADYYVSGGNFSVESEIDRTTDRMSNISFIRNYGFDVTMIFKGDYESFGAVTLSLNVKITGKYSFNWYHAVFTSRNLYLNPGDYQALPVSVMVNDEAESGKDFTLTFVSADESKVTIDEDGVITAVALTDEPVEVNMKLEYLGKIFEDKLLVTVTDLEVE